VYRGTPLDPLADLRSKEARYYEITLYNKENKEQTEMLF